MRPLIPVPFSVVPPPSASHAIHHSRLRNVGIPKLVTNGKDDENNIFLINCENKFLFDDNTIEMGRNHEYYRFKELTISISNTENYLKARGAYQLSYIHDPEGKLDATSSRFQDTQLVRIGKSTVWKVPVLSKWLYTHTGGENSKRLTTAGQIVLRIRNKRHNTKDQEPNNAESYFIGATIDAVFEFASKTRILRLGGVVVRQQFFGVASGGEVADYCKLFTKTDDRDYYMDFKINYNFDFKPTQGFFYLQAPVMVTLTFHSSEEPTKLIIYEFLLTSGNFYQAESDLMVFLRVKLDIGSAYDGTSFAPDSLYLQRQYVDAYEGYGILTNYITFMPDDFEADRSKFFKDHRPKKYIQ